MITYNILAYLSVYLMVINLYGLIIMWTDKRYAKSGKWRIAEKQLMFIGLLGGGPGTMAGMLIFRHKTQHKKFYLGLPLILLTQWMIVIVALIYLSDIMK